jgi:probable F420-dependent oxidoreductase
MTPKWSLRRRVGAPALRRPPMKVDFMLTGEPGDWNRAAEAETIGYDGAWAPEISHDPFPMLALVADKTHTLRVGTAIALAFARNPMSFATSANDLQLYSGGRFALGVGSQVQTHIVERFSMPWSRPTDRMRDYLMAVRAIWRSWETGDELDYRGEFYSHTLMPPFFNPGPNPHGNPPILLAGVGPRMTRVAGEVADGFMVHGFTTEKYLREVTVPALKRGRADRGQRGLDGYEISGFPFIVTGENDFQRQVADLAVRSQIAFYGSTPAYRPVLELHGWEGVGDELHRRSKRGEWPKMAQLITDEMLQAFAIVAPPDQVATQLLQRYGDVYTRIGFYAPYPMPKTFWDPIMKEVKSIAAEC